MACGRHSRLTDDELDVPVWLDTGRLHRRAAPVGQYGPLVHLAPRWGASRGKGLKGSAGYLYHRCGRRCRVQRTDSGHCFRSRGHLAAFLDESDRANRHVRVFRLSGSVTGRRLKPPVRPCRVSTDLGNSMPAPLLSFRHSCRPVHAGDPPARGGDIRAVSAKLCRRSSSAPGLCVHTEVLGLARATRPHAGWCSARLSHCSSCIQAGADRFLHRVWHVWRRLLAGSLKWRRCRGWPVDGWSDRLRVNDGVSDCGMAAVASAVIGAPVAGVLIILELTMNYDFTGRRGQHRGIDRD